MKFKIYGLECLVNHKIYVGKTSKTLEERIARHKVADSFIGRAIRKYGWEESFIAVILAECETEEEANQLEKFWIAKLNCKVPNGYNLTDGGEGTAGFKQTPETLAKRSAARKGKPGHPLSAEARAKLSAANKGRKLSDETRAKLSAANKGRKLSAEHCAKISVAHKGKKMPPCSQERRAKISAANKGRKFPPPSKETLAKRSAALKGRKFSAEHRAKISAALKNRKK